jgi:hypothetical protein
LVTEVYHIHRLFDWIDLIARPSESKRSEPFTSLDVSIFRKKSAYILPGRQPRILLSNLSLSIGEPIMEGLPGPETFLNHPINCILIPVGEWPGGRLYQNIL